MSALFNFQSLLTVILLLICTCAYIRSISAKILDKHKQGLLGIFWKCARIDVKSSCQETWLLILHQLGGSDWVSLPSVYCKDKCERKSPYVAVSCLAMAFAILFGS